jgi:stearoyl-CoA desaturase (delta-9 desaturase)
MPSVLLSLVAAVVVCQFATLLTTLYLHRTLSHRALVLAPGVVAVVRTLLWVTTGIRPRQWVAVHRKHHAFSDEDGDPHSPIIEGFAMVQFGNVALYRKALRDPQLVARYARDIPHDRWDKVLFDHAFVGLTIGITILCLTIGLWAGLLAAVLHTAMYLLLNAGINAIGHTVGRQPFPNKARNNQWLAWMTSGEGLHNNHHAASTSASFALNRGDIDPGWWVVRLLASRGWASVRLSEERVQERLAS